MTFAVDSFSENSFFFYKQSDEDLKASKFIKLKKIDSEGQIEDSSLRCDFDENIFNLDSTSLANLNRLLDEPFIHSGQGAIPLNISLTMREITTRIHPLGIQLLLVGGEIWKQIKTQIQPIMEEFLKDIDPPYRTLQTITDVFWQVLHEDSNDTDWQVWDSKQDENSETPEHCVEAIVELLAKKFAATLPNPIQIHSELTRLKAHATESHPHSYLNQIFRKYDRLEDKNIDLYQLYVEAIGFTNAANVFNNEIDFLVRTLGKNDILFLRKARPTTTHLNAACINVTPLLDPTLANPLLKLESLIQSNPPLKAILQTIISKNLNIYTFDARKPINYGDFGRTLSGMTFGGRFYQTGWFNKVIQNLVEESKTKQIPLEILVYKELIQRCQKHHNNDLTILYTLTINALILLYDAGILEHDVYINLWRKIQQFSGRCVLQNALIREIATLINRQIPFAAIYAQLQISSHLVQHQINSFSQDSLSETAEFTVSCLPTQSDERIYTQIRFSLAHGKTIMLMLPYELHKAIMTLPLFEINSRCLSDLHAVFSGSRLLNYALESSPLKKYTSDRRRFFFSCLLDSFPLLRCYNEHFWDLGYSLILSQLAQRTNPQSLMLLFEQFLILIRSNWTTTEFTLSIISNFDRFLKSFDRLHQFDCALFENVYENRNFSSTDALVELIIAFLKTNTSGYIELALNLMENLEKKTQDNSALFITSVKACTHPVFLPQALTLLIHRLKQQKCMPVEIKFKLLLSIFSKVPSSSSKKPLETKCSSTSISLTEQENEHLEDPALFYLIDLLLKHVLEYLKQMQGPLEFDEKGHLVSTLLLQLFKKQSKEGDPFETLEWIENLFRLQLFKKKDGILAWGIASLKKVSKVEEEYVYLQKCRTFAENVCIGKVPFVDLLESVSYEMFLNRIKVSEKNCYLVAIDVKKCAASKNLELKSIRSLMINALVEAPVSLDSLRSLEPSETLDPSQSLVCSENSKSQLVLETMYLLELIEEVLPLIENFKESLVLLSAFARISKIQISKEMCNRWKKQIDFYHNKFGMSFILKIVAWHAEHIESFSNDEKCVFEIYLISLVDRLLKNQSHLKRLETSDGKEAVKILFLSLLKIVTHTRYRSISRCKLLLDSILNTSFLEFKFKIKSFIKFQEVCKDTQLQGLKIVLFNQLLAFLKNFAEIPKDDTIKAKLTIFALKLAFLNKKSPLKILKFLDVLYRLKLIGTNEIITIWDQLLWLCSSKIGPQNKTLLEKCLFFATETNSWEYLSLYQKNTIHELIHERISASEIPAHLEILSLEQIERVLKSQEITSIKTVFILLNRWNLFKVPFSESFLFLDTMVLWTQNSLSPAQMNSFCKLLETYLDKYKKSSPTQVVTFLTPYLKKISHERLHFQLVEFILNSLEQLGEGDPFFKGIIVKDFIISLRKASTPKETSQDGYSEKIRKIDGEKFLQNLHHFHLTSRISHFIICLHPILETSFSVFKTLVESLFRQIAKPKPNIPLEIESILEDYSTDFSFLENELVSFKFREVCLFFSAACTRRNHFNDAVKWLKNGYKKSALDFSFYNRIFDVAQLQTNAREGQEAIKLLTTSQIPIGYESKWLFICQSLVQIKDFDSLLVIFEKKKILPSLGIHTDAYQKDWIKFIEKLLSCSLKDEALLRSIYLLLSELQKDEDSSLLNTLWLKCISAVTENGSLALSESVFNYFLYALEKKISLEEQQKITCWNLFLKRFSKERSKVLFNISEWWHEIENIQFVPSSAQKEDYLKLIFRNIARSIRLSDSKQRDTLIEKILSTFNSNRIVPCKREYLIKNYDSDLLYYQSQIFNQGLQSKCHEKAIECLRELFQIKNISDKLSFKAVKLSNLCFGKILPNLHTTNMDSIMDCIESMQKSPYCNEANHLTVLKCIVRLHQLKFFEQDERAYFRSIMRELKGIFTSPPNLLESHSIKLVNNLTTEIVTTLNYLRRNNSNKFSTQISKMNSFCIRILPQPHLPLYLSSHVIEMLKSSANQSNRLYKFSQSKTIAKCFEVSILSFLVFSTLWVVFLHNTRSI